MTRKKRQKKMMITKGGSTDKKGEKPKPLQSPSSLRFILKLFRRGLYLKIVATNEKISTLMGFRNLKY